MGNFNQKFSCFLKDEMGLRMKNFNIMRVHWKIQFLEGDVTKNQYVGGNCLKRGAGGGRLGQFAYLRRVLAEEDGGWCFWESLIPQCGLCNTGDRAGQIARPMPKKRVKNLRHARFFGCKHFILWKRKTLGLNFQLNK